MSDYLVSLTFGGAIIAIFAWDQFKRPSYAASRELSRLIEFLAPPDLRNRRIYFRAYLAYAAILVFIYLVLCLFATYPVLSALGLAQIDGAADTADPGALRSASFPLALSLVMIGLAPGVPLLQRFEEKIRFAAHHLSGIPARLLQGCRLLQARRLQFPHQRGLLIPEQDWKRLEHYRSCGKLILKDPEDFIYDMEKILAFRAWFLKHRLISSDRAPRPGIERNEEELKARIDHVLISLDAISAFEDINGITESTLARRENWEAFAQEADRLCADVCAMLMLYVEHGLVDFERAPIAPDQPEFDDAECARKTLIGFLQGTVAWADESALTSMLWWRMTITSGVASFAYGALFGPEDMSGLAAGGMFLLSAIVIYSLAVFVGLSVHASNVRKEVWPNMTGTDWSRWIGPVAGLFLACALFAVVGSSVLNLYDTIGEYGVIAVMSKFGEALEGAVLNDGPQAMVGAILAVGTVASVDEWRQHSSIDTSRRRQFWILLTTVGAVVIWTPLASALGIQYSSMGPGNTVASLPAIVMDRTLYSGIGPGIVCLAALLVCQRTLSCGLPSSATESPERLPATDSASPAH